MGVEGAHRPRLSWGDQFVTRPFPSVQTGRPKGLLVDMRGDEFTDDDCGRFDAGFTRLFGDMYRRLPLRFLEGPKAWIENLSEYRKYKHGEWVKTSSLLQSHYDTDYIVPVHLNEIHPDFFESDKVANTMVYVKHFPEIQEREMLEMLLSWFGMVWIGNPFILGVKILYEDTADHGGISTGTAALRFASVELAERVVAVDRLAGHVVASLRVAVVQHEQLVELARVLPAAVLLVGVVPTAL